MDRWLNYLQWSLHQLCPSWQVRRSNPDHFYYTDRLYLSIYPLKEDGQVSLFGQDVGFFCIEARGEYGIDVDGIKFYPNKNNKEAWKSLLLKLHVTLFPGVGNVENAVNAAINTIDWQDNAP